MSDVDNSCAKQSLTSTLNVGSLSSITVGSLEFN